MLYIICSEKNLNIVSIFSRNTSFWDCENRQKIFKKIVKKDLIFLATYGIIPRYAMKNSVDMR